MSRYKAYPEYRDSGLQWLGEIPAHWEVMQSRRLFAQRKEKAQPSDKQLTASQKYGVIYQKLFMELEGQSVVQVLIGSDILKHVEENDFVISMRSFQGGLEWCQYSGSVSSAYVGIIPVKYIFPGFFRYLFKSESYVQALQSTSNLVRDGQALRFENFSQVPLPRIPEHEQNAIAAFLDHETAKIDVLIEKQQRLIELLKEKRQAVISHAVTKGLNPNAPMKDSGVEWLGEVPAHWVLGKCGFYVSILPGYAFQSSGFSDCEEDTRLLRGINVGVSCLKWDAVVYWRRTPSDGLDTYAMKEGDIVIGMDRPLIGEGIRVAKIKSADLPCMLLQRVASIKTNESLDADYLLILLSSNMFAAHFTPDTTGVSVPHISPEQIGSFVIPIPSVDEQKRIVAFVSSESSKLLELIDRAETAISLMQERRTALISAAVTGKIDMRDWQAAA